MTERQTRAERARMPLASEVVRAAAIDNGVCIRPVSVRRIDLATGTAELVDLPCGATLANKCPSCAERARRLRIAQCREGWHLDTEPVRDAEPATDEQRELATVRADLERARVEAEDAGEDPAEVEAVIDQVDELVAQAGIRGRIGAGTAARRVRSTRRRQDAPDLPRRRVDSRTVGRIYAERFRPSLFVTATLDSYGPVRSDGTPVDPDRYDYVRAARDAIHFSRLVDRFVQNLRRFVGWDVQYFATVEPQRRLAPHLHLAMRGTVSRVELRQVAAATYHQVWWPQCDQVVYDGVLPAWDPDRVTYVDPETGAPLPIWDAAIDELDQPAHIARFGVQVDARGVLAGSPDANRAMGYLAKYLTKSVADCHRPESDRQREHMTRLLDVLRWEPCSERCANWLRYGVQPRNARDGLRPGSCRGRAHRAEHLGYAGRRVLVSRKWSGKTLGDHRADRRDWVLNLLGTTAEPTAVNRYAWEPAGGSTTPSAGNCSATTPAAGSGTTRRSATAGARPASAICGCTWRRSPSCPSERSRPASSATGYGTAMRGTGGNTSIAQSYRFLRSVMNAAVREGAILRNPCTIPGAGADRAKERPTATPAQIAALVDAITPRYRAAVLIAAWGGLRRGEIVGLHREDVDLAAGTVRVRRSRAELLESKVAYDKDPKSEAGKRTVALPPHILPVLAVHLDRWAGDERVFVGRTGEPMRGDAIRQAFTRARAKVGMDDFRFHDLRHTGQTLAAATGATLADLKKRLGHSSDVAAIRYLHSTHGRDQMIAEALSALAHQGDASLLPSEEAAPHETA
jgi:integrase